MTTGLNSAILKFREGGAEGSKMQKSFFIELVDRESQVVQQNQKSASWVKWERDIRLFDRENDLFLPHQIELRS